ncbi:MAG: FISUMP domain-containing protein [Prevotella sp.]
MKKSFTNLRKSLCVAALAGMALVPIPACAQSWHPVYKITFGGRGESKTVDKVLVENLSNGRSVELSGKDTLLLTSSVSGIEGVLEQSNDGKVTIEGGQLLMNLQHPTDVQVNVYGLDGSLALQTRLAASSREVSMPLPPLRKGVYVVRATAPGLNKSVKWLCGGSSSLSAPAISTLQEVASDEPVQESLNSPLQSLFALDNEQMGGVELIYEKGDVLRFTGTSGDMTTITTNSPRSTHPVYFDFFKCQDADGYNYAIVRAGDMLWMAEDLRRVNSLKINDAGIMSSELLTSVIGNPDMPLMATEGNNTYYSKAAAIKALPEGWRLPTQGEIDYAIKKLNGGNYNTAGAYLKGDGAGRVDSTSLHMTANGRFDANGSVADGGKGYFMTRSTKGGIMLAMVYSDDNDLVEVNTCEGYLIPVRGVRAAPSAYTEMMETFGYTSKNAKGIARVPTRLKKSGPLGKKYTAYDLGQSIAYDYSSGQYNSTGAEARSGILFKEDGTTKWTWHSNRGTNFLSDCGTWNMANNALRKMAAMNNGKGTQYVVEMQWGRRCLIRTEYNNGSFTFSDAPDVFSRDHEDGVYITIAGDHNEGYAVKNPQTGNGQHKGFYIPLNAYMKPLSKDILNFTGWSTDGKRRSEARLDYVQRIFQLLTADFNGDGVDELVIGVDGEVWVYDGATMLEAVNNNSIDKTYDEKPLYHKNFNLNDDGTEKDGSQCSILKPVTRFAVGDVDGDGISDITVLQVGVTDETSGKGKAELMLFRSGNVEAEPLASRIIHDDCGNSIFCDVKVGNVSAGNYNDIILFFRDYTDADGFAKYGYLWHAMYNPNESGGIYKAGSGQVNSFRLDTRRAGNMNVTLAHLHGSAKPCDVVVGADMWSWDEDLGNIKYDYQVLPAYDNSWWSILADNIVAADPGAEGKDYLYYFYAHSTYEGGDVFVFQGFGETWYAGTEITEESVQRGLYFNSDYFKYSNSGSQWGSDDLFRQMELMWWYRYNGTCEWGSTSALCAVNARRGPNTKVLEYKGYQATFSEPRIHALIAAPPTFDYGNETEPNYDFVTSWGYSTSTSQQTTKSSSITASVIVGFEAEINAPITGTKLGGVDFTMKMQNECTNSTSKSNTITYSQLYEARDDDRVVMQVTPYDTYTYEVVDAANVDQIGNEVVLSTPQETMTVGLALTDYERLMADDKNAPNLREVFKHQIGDPFSYPKSNEQIKSNVLGSEVLWGNGQWDSWVTTGSGGSVIREISLDESTAESAAFTFSVETELVVTALGAKAGAGFGYGNTNETTHEESKGFTVSACVPGLAPGDQSPNRSFFDWNLCWYKYKLAGQTFPVVNYVVKKR